MDDVREIIKCWCEENEYYELAHRISFVPVEILEKLMFEFPPDGIKILENEGY